MAGFGQTLRTLQARADRVGFDPGLSRRNGDEHQQRQGCEMGHSAHGSTSSASEASGSKA